MFPIFYSNVFIVKLVTRSEMYNLITINSPSIGANLFADELFLSVSVLLFNSS